MSISKQRYPFFIEIYKGEGRMLVIPLIHHRGGNRIELGENSCIEEVENERKIGKIVLESIEKIKNTPLSDATPAEVASNIAWEKNSKYKNWISFWKNNNYVLVSVYENGNYNICSYKRAVNRRGHYHNSIKIIELNLICNVEDIGKAVIDVFYAAEEYHKQIQACNKHYMQTVHLLNGSKLSFYIFNDSHFTDNADSGAAEIYQCYSYSTSENTEAVAEFFLGIAPELNCNLQPENVRNSWEEYYGVADCFEMKEVDYGIFKFRIEMKNKDSHKISYILQQDEDLLLECGMEVHSPNRRKKTDEKLEKMFEEFSLNCRIS